MFENDEDTLDLWDVHMKCHAAKKRILGTNLYGIPLLNIVGVTSTNETFNETLAFLDEKCRDDYHWALQQLIKIVVPEVMVTESEPALMNAFSIGKPAFKTEEYWEAFIKSWNAMVSRRIFEEYQQDLEVFRKTFSQTNPNFMRYLEARWLLHQAHFVSSLLIDIRTLEGNHHVIKAYFKPTHSLGFRVVHDPIQHIHNRYLAFAASHLLKHSLQYPYGGIVFLQERVCPLVAIAS
ncbi:hypothetical protein PsorP6_000598 [Peronosclerospora sorghi]|uniref:Uncharacterized protein n=1 Tax=Peronosclerospora sorghi TaxID=230839 RepID=A0ACC0WYI2_9STRA|nr:hypothetical protein PsorP6_000598 [Peronosclerospora sorghi]